MKGELSQRAVVAQAEAFAAHQAKAGKVCSISTWMDHKGFRPADREQIRRAYWRILEREVWSEEEGM